MEHIFERYNSNQDTNNQDTNNQDTNNQDTNNQEYNENDFEHQEYQYINLIKNILKNGYLEEGRNGVTKSIFGASMRFSLKDGIIPILTTKKVAWKTCLKELLWFIRGETDNKVLNNQNVHIWDANSSREFLDSRGLFEYEEGECGPIYGRQWRYFNAECDINGKKIKGSNGIDQLQEIINVLKDPEQRTSRRLVMTAWNPSQLNLMALPPCHCLCQFSVKNGNELYCALYQRSNDEACGTSFNIASYSLLTHLLARHCGLKAHEFIYFKGDCHIYEPHIEGMQLQIQRKPYPFPTIHIKQIKENINDYNVEDFEIKNYKHHEQIKFQMIA
jgi:thymidylate synthase